MSRKVYKYATGETIPKGAVYLSTQVEKVIVKERHVDYQGNPTDAWDIIEKNRFVWHYFLVGSDPTSIPEGKKPRIRGF